MDTIDIIPADATTSMSTIRGKLGFSTSQPCSFGLVRGSYQTIPNTFLSIGSMLSLLSGFRPTLYLDAKKHTSGSTTWQDHSGNGYHFQIVSTAYTTLTGLTYMNFSGSHGCAKRIVNSVLTDVPPSANATLLVISRSQPNTTSARTLLRGARADHQVILRVGSHDIGMYDNDQSKYILTQTLEARMIPYYTDQFNLLVFKLSQSSPQFQCALIQPADKDPFGNRTGSLNGWHVIEDADAGFLDGFCSIGGYHNGSTTLSTASQYWGDVACVLYYNSHLSDTQILDVQRRFRFTDRLPSGTSLYPTDLRMYLRFPEEAVGSPAPWTDVTSNGYHGLYITGSGIVHKTQLYGGGFTTPANQVTHYILLPETALQNLSSGFQCTFSCWLMVLSHDGNLKYMWSMAAPGNTNGFILEFASETVGIYAGAGGRVSGVDPTWHLNEPMCITVSRNNTAFKLYKNGVVITTYTLSRLDFKTVTGWVLDQEQDTIKGGFQDTQNLHAHWFETMLYNRTLTDADVLTEFYRTRYRYQSALPPISAVLALTMQTGSTWIDMSGNGYHASYNGTLTTTSRFRGGYTTPANQITNYILLSESALQNVPDGYNVTICCWFEVLSFTNTRYLLSMATSQQDNAFLVQLNESTISMHNQYTSLVSGTNPTWTIDVPLFLTITRSNTTITLFRNGVQQAVYNYTNTLDFKNVEGWVLDQEQDSVKGGFDPGQNTHANWYEVYLHRTVLSNASILQEFERTRGRYGV